MQLTVLCPIALQSRNATSFVEKLNGATMFRTPKTYLQQRVFSPIRLNGTVDVAFVACRQVGDVPHVIHKLVPRQLLWAHPSGVTCALKLPHGVRSGTEWPHPPLHKGGDQMDACDLVQHASDLSQQRACLLHFFG